MITALPRTMTTFQVAQLLSVDERTVRSWCKAGKLPARFIARCWRIKPQLIEERDPELYAELLEALEP